jgi:hypothetical protein
VANTQSDIEALLNPSAPNYLGEPPAEVARAWKRLTSAVKGAAQYETIRCPGSDCVETAGLFTLAWEQLGDAYTAWEPWL